MLAALEEDAAGAHPRCGGRSPMIERDSTVLPEPDSPTTPSVLPRSSAERDAVDRVDGPAVGLEVGVEVLDLEERAVERRVREAIGTFARAGAVLTGRSRGRRTGPARRHRGS